MKTMHQLIVAATLLAVGFHGSGAFRTTLDFMSRGGGTSAEGEFQSEATLSNMISEMMTENGPSIQAVSEAAINRMDEREALRRLQGKLPADVTSLVRMSSASRAHSRRGFLEASIQKARVILNTMIEESWADLDKVVIACKEFYLKNRKTYLQVVRDLNRLGSQISTADGKRIEAQEGIAREIRAKTELDRELAIETKKYKTERALNEADLAVKRGDEAVFEFVLSMVRCEETSTLLAQQNSKNNASFRICNVGGKFQLNFDNPKLQAKVEKSMTPNARQIFHEILGKMEAQGAFLQVNESAKQVTTKTEIITFQVIPEPVIDKTIPSLQGKKCTDGEPNCGLLHDIMAMQWGKFKDLVDELVHEMDQNEDAWEKLKDDLNAQITASNEAKGAWMEQLAKAVSDINADSAERAEKDEERRQLAKAMDKKRAQCHEKISEILFTHICAVRKVRNAVLKYSSTSPLPQVVDCVVSDWKPQKCSVECDDSCPDPLNPYACGGEQLLLRDAIQPNNTFGIACPALNTTKKCNQIKCPVDCVMSRWSDWSSCTKDCEGGVNTRTRAIMVIPKNGGKECETPTDERACNTGSCDRDCSLVAWTDWSPCSMACNGGLATRQRTVLIPIRGNGRCPGVTSFSRFNERQCNTQECVGDEICIANQDLIMLVDGSGSLKEDGFAVLRTFAANLTDRYKPEYYGASLIRVGVGLFGNGRLEADGSIRRATMVQALTADMADTKTKIHATTWQKGFTNLAQGFALADKMLTEQGREDAQSAVMVLWDGKLNFEFQTKQQAKALRDKNVQIFISPVIDTSGEELDFMKTELASQPWETNFLRIPGLLALKENEALFQGQIIAKFCSDSISPSLEKAKDEQRDYALMREGGWPSNACGHWYWVGRVQNMDDCAEAARGYGYLAFSIGKGRWASNYCYAEAVEVTAARWEALLNDRRGPACPNGYWVRNPYYDTYAMNPNNGR